MNYSKLGDLYIPTCISLVNHTSGRTKRLWSTDPEYANLSLVDILMASTAIPVAFTPRAIPELDSEPIWIDGGTGMDSIPVYPLLVSPQVTDIYMIAYHSVLFSEGTDVPWYLGHLTILKNAMAAFGSMRADLNRGGKGITHKS
jgi:predicted acylesterase/phospholipase RssA